MSHYNVLLQSLVATLVACALHALWELLVVYHISPHGQTNHEHVMKPTNPSEN